MADISGNYGLLPRTRDSAGMIRHHEIANAEVAYLGGLYGLNSSGKATKLAATAGLRPRGIARKFGGGCALRDGTVPEKVTGDSSAAEPPTIGLEEGGFTLEDVPVAGGADTDADKGAKVYAYGNDWATAGTLTMTRNNTQPRPIGEIVKRTRPGYYNVYHWPAAVIDAYREEWADVIVVGGINAAALEGTSAADLLTITLEGQGRIDSMSLRVVDFSASLIAGAQTLLAKINDVAVTHPSWVVGFVNANAITDLNTLIAVVPTAANTWTDGQSFKVTLVASGTGFTADIDKVIYEVRLNVTRYV